jgi:hypothetical protein
MNFISRKYFCSFITLEIYYIYPFNIPLLAKDDNTARIMHRAVTEVQPLKDVVDLLISLVFLSSTYTQYSAGTHGRERYLKIK